MKITPRQFSIGLFILFLAVAPLEFYMIFGLKRELLYVMGITSAQLETMIGYRINNILIFSILEFVFGVTVMVLIMFYINKPVIVDFSDIELDDENRDYEAKDRKKSQSKSIDFTSVKSFLEACKANKSNEIQECGEQFFSAISSKINLVQGILYMTEEFNNDKFLVFTSGYAYFKSESKTERFLFGEGIAGQVAKSQHSVYIDSLPSGYISVVSGLGSSSPKYLLVVPLVYEKVTLGVMELAFFDAINDKDKDTLIELVQSLSGIIKEKTSLV